jgi:two-component system chemotaxis response regulator CheY
MAVDLAMKVLVVDDDPALVDVGCRLFAQLGFTDVEGAADGSAAFARLKQARFGLVLSDWNMEPMDGLELLNAVRADQALKAIPFILATADTAPGRRAEALAAGVSGYMAKPFDRPALKACLQEVLGAF